MTPFKIIFVHGYTASPARDWYPDMDVALRKHDVDFSAPALPGGKQPHAHEWLNIIHQEVTKTNKPIVLVGHSLGTRAVLLYLDQYRPRLEAVILIAPLSNEVKNAQRRGGSAYPDFFKTKLVLNDLKESSHQWLILHSRDDHSLPYAEHGQALAIELGVKLLTFDDRDHFSQAENAPIIFQVLQDTLRF